MNATFVDDVDLDAPIILGEDELKFFRDFKCEADEHGADGHAFSSNTGKCPKCERLCIALEK